VNDAPVLATPIPDQSATEDTPFSYTVPAGSFTDIDAGDTLTWSATRSDGSALPAWLSFDPAARALSGTPGNADVGSVSLRITVTDMAGATASDTFDVTVANVNDSPPPAVDPPVGGAPATPVSPGGDAPASPIQPSPGLPSSGDAAQPDSGTGSYTPVPSAPAPAPSTGTGTAARPDITGSSGPVPGLEAGAPGSGVRVFAHASESHHDPSAVTGPDAIANSDAGLLRVGVPTQKPLVSPPLVDTFGGRSELADLLRRIREQAVAPEFIGVAPSSRSALFIDPVTQPRPAGITAPIGMTLGPANAAQITGLVATAGLTIWVARSAGLTFALLASVPIWRNLDPLYILPANPAGGESTDEQSDDMPPVVVPAAWQAAGRLVVSMDGDDR
ncbi:MAG: putative Ig domain-containing protein, partial [Proteobacteria bacterium]|nr:putative Ig domain-containing protein [Pseudomonadota bacterium]